MFAVDNQRPTIDDADGQRTRAPRARPDAISPITEIAFSVDDGAVAARHDRPTACSTTSPRTCGSICRRPRAGTHTLAIRVADAAGNIGSVSTTFVIK